MRNIDNFGAVLSRHGLPITLGRALGLVLVTDDPLGLDEIAEVLEISKSAASRTMRDLERLGMVRRRATAGSKRIVFEAIDGGEGVLLATIARFVDLRDLFANEAGALRKGTARTRLEALAGLYDLAVEESQKILVRWRRQAA